MSKLIFLNLEKFATVDDADYEALNSFNWFVHTDDTRETCYAIRNKLRGYDGTTCGTVKMHRQIMGITDPEIHIDHDNGEGLDNRRQNLQVLSRSHNQLKRKLNYNNRTGLKGVSFENNKYQYVSAKYQGRHLYKGKDFFEACCKRKAAENIPKGDED